MVFRSIIVPPLVSYNLYAGSVVGLGTDEQREALYETQAAGELGCFAFTERGTGVLSGAAVETTATFDGTTGGFVIQTPADSAQKNWISQVRDDVKLHNGA